MKNFTGCFYSIIKKFYSISNKLVTLLIKLSAWKSYSIHLISSRIFHLFEPLFPSFVKHWYHYIIGMSVSIVSTVLGVCIYFQVLFSILITITIFPQTWQSWPPYCCLLLIHRTCLYIQQSFQTNCQVPPLIY